MPPIISASNSDRVMRGMNGLTINGASVWPNTTFAVTANVSAPEVRSNLPITQATAFTKNCKTP